MRATVQSTILMNLEDNYFILQFKYRAIKLIYNRVIHVFESVRLFRLICRDVTHVSHCDNWSLELSNDIRFRIHG
jgi:hypothetical protein